MKNFYRTSDFNNINFFYLNKGPTTSSFTGDADKTKADTKSLFNFFTSIALTLLDHIFKGDDAYSFLQQLQNAFDGLNGFLSAFSGEITGLVEGVDVITYTKKQKDIVVQAGLATQKAFNSGIRGISSLAINDDALFNKGVLALKTLQSAINRIVNAVVNGSDVYPSFENFIQALKDVQQCLSLVIGELKNAPDLSFDRKAFLTKMNGFVGQSITAAQNALNTATLERDVDAVIDELDDFLVGLL